MEIRCEKCGHLGPAAEVKPVEGGVGLICGQCGHPNVIAMGSVGPTPEAATAKTSELEERSHGQAPMPIRTKPSPGLEQDVAVAETWTGRALEGSRKVQNKEKEALSALMLERLLPEPGEGLRCPKCVALIAGDDEHCARCGLSLAEGLRYQRGEQPWEKPPVGREALWEQAWLLWESVEERGSSQKLEDFVAFVLDEGLIDFGIRRLQHYLVDHRDDPVARRGLASLSRQMEKTLQVARTQAEAGAESFTGEVKRFRTWLMLGTLLFWVVILLLLSVTFWDRF